MLQSAFGHHMLINCCFNIASLIQSIETSSAVDIMQYSAFPMEDEVLLLPGTTFKVYMRSLA